MKTVPWIAQIDRLWKHGPHQVTPAHPQQAIMIGHEHFPHGAAYDWRGETRRCDPRGAELIIQVGLAGWGLFSAGADQIHGPGGVPEQRIDPGMFFLTIVPSAHHYHLPAASPGWRFWWTQILYPAAVERAQRIISSYGAIHAFDPNSAFADYLRTVSRSVLLGQYSDLLLFERDVTVLLIELERMARPGDPASEASSAMETLVRNCVMSHPDRNPSLTDLATMADRSPSAFGHHFRSLCGQSPIRFATLVRLQALSRDLLSGQHTLADLASTYGFADANHLCKVFRRHYGCSPGAWRQR